MKENNLNRTDRMVEGSDQPITLHFYNFPISLHFLNCKHTHVFSATSTFTPKSIYFIFLQILYTYASFNLSILQICACFFELLILPLAPLQSNCLSTSAHLPPAPNTMCPFAQRTKLLSWSPAAPCYCLRTWPTLKFVLAEKPFHNLFRISALCVREGTVDKREREIERKKSLLTYRDKKIIPLLMTTYAR